MRELFKLSAILTIICSLAAFSLALAYKHTKAPIAEQERLKKTRALKAVFSGDEIPSDLPVVDLKTGTDKNGKDLFRRFYLIKKDNEITGIAFELFAGGYNGEIDIMVGLTGNFELSGIKIIRHVETPGLGANITTDAFVSQFKGMSLDKTAWKVKKNGGDIDQVTGATISSNAVLEAVHGGLQFAAEHRLEILNHEPLK